MNEAGEARWLVPGAAGLGLAAVVLAALGSHAVDFADERAIRVWTTATGMIGFHSLALLAIAGLRPHRPSRLLDAAATLMGTGTVLFSGTLLLHALGVAGVPGALAPAGGFLIMAGWVGLGLTGVKKSCR